MTITRRPSNLTRSESESSLSTSSSTYTSTFTSSSSIAEEAAKHSDPLMLHNHSHNHNHNHHPRAKRVRISETVVMIEIDPNQAPIRTTASTATGSGGSRQEEARTTASRCDLPQPWSLCPTIPALFSISRWDNGHREGRDVAPTAAIRKRRSTTDVIDLALAIVEEDDFLF